MCFYIFLGCDYMVSKIIDYYDLHYRSELRDHLFFNYCLNYLNINSMSDKILPLNKLNAIKILFKMSPE